MIKIEMKETTLMDDSKVFDVNIFANSNPKFGTKAIFSCPSEKDSIAFAEGLTKLIEKHTNEIWEEV